MENSPLKVVRPTIEIVAPNTENVHKVANMARICYRSESAAGPEADIRLVQGCIKRRHTSVTEHAFMSVFFTKQNKIDTSAFGIDVGKETSISTYDIWSTMQSPNKKKYLAEIWDDMIYTEIQSGAATPRAYHVTTGNFRAWLNCLDECLGAAIEHGNPLYVAFVMATIIACHKKYPVIFGELVEKCNRAFASCTQDHYLREWFLPKIDNADERNNTTLTVEHFARFAPQFGIVAAQTTPKYSFSVVWKTTRSVTHELVRHRVCAFSQESQRWVNYDKKGFEVIAPSLDPKKFEHKKFRTVKDTPNEGEDWTADDKGFAELLFQGYIPETTVLYHKWLGSMKNAVAEYEDFLVESGVDTDGDYIQVPPEFCRGVLNNDCATTIGVTWTPDGFLNFMQWRLDAPAFWPIRRQTGETVIKALEMRHPFFENFSPTTIRMWLKQCVEFGIIYEDDPKLATLREYQDRRQKDIEEQIRQAQEAVAKQAQAEAAKNAAQAAEATPESK